MPTHSDRLGQRRHPLAVAEEPHPLIAGECLWKFITDELMSEDPEKSIT